MAQILFDAPAVSLFRKLFGEFADDAAYPDEVLQIRWGEATSYVSDDDYGDLPTAKRLHALQLLTAHVCRLAAMIAQAATGLALTGVVVSAQIDKVQVQLQPPPSRGEWGHWLAQTPYGQQLSALLAVQSAGGFYVGGAGERFAFRRVGGSFL